jgi:hypothetical protein
MGDIPNMETNMSTRKLFALSLFAAIALSSAALAQGGGGGGGEREGAAQVVLAAEQPAGPVVQAERRGQLAERGQQVAQRRARPIQVRQAVA